MCLNCIISGQQGNVQGECSSALSTGASAAVASSSGYTSAVKEPEKGKILIKIYNNFI